MHIFHYGRHCHISLQTLPRFFFPTAPHSPIGQGLLIAEASRSHTHYTRQASPGLVISPLQRPLPDNTQHLQETDIHDPGGIQTHNSTNQKPGHLIATR